jgi:phosphatidylglycerophosphate synthase
LARNPLHNLIVDKERILLYLPSAFTALRLTCLPFFIFSMNAQQMLLADTLFLSAIASDFADGFLARKLGKSTKFGASFDIFVDFSFVFGVFLYFVFAGYYPAWILLLIGAMFAQFVVTSKLTKTRFDPIGKYYGSLLYGAIGLTVLFPVQPAMTAITIALTGVTMFSLASRAIFLVQIRFKPEQRRLRIDVSKKQIAN